MPETYTTAAAKGFTRLYDLYALYNTKDLFDGNFWFAGNALHTMLDYLINIGVADPPVLTMVPCRLQEVFPPIHFLQVVAR
jgi:hypothetical protein